MAAPPRPSKGDIILFPFPYTDQKGSKLRPCLVLSAPLGEDHILCQITSQRTRKDDHAVTLNQEDTTNGNLSRDSYIRCEMLFTANTSDKSNRVLCTVKDEIYREVVKKIISIIA